MEAAQPSNLLVLIESRRKMTGLSSCSEKPSLMPLWKACDYCRRRKTKCDRQLPCGACSIASLRCQYLTIHQKRGPKRRNSAVKVGSPESSDQLSPPETSMTSENSSSPLSSEASYFQNGTDSHIHLSSYTSDTGDGPCSQPLFNPLFEIPSFDESDTIESFDAPVDYIVEQLTNGSTLDTNYRTQSIFLPGDPVAPSIGAPTQGYQAIAPPLAIFMPYINLFFEHLYPIMPIFDQKTMLADLAFRTDRSESLCPEDIAMFSALSAAVILQLNITIDEAEVRLQKFGGSGLERKVFSRIGKGGNAMKALHSAECFISQCLSARQQSDFIETPTVSWVITSFFLFACYGNLERHRSAWYHLREAIGLSLELGLDVEESYNGMEVGESQRRKRLFWLLFVTERGYGLQQRRGVVLQPSISLPLIFESEDPCLLHGFVNLINLFKSVDRKFSNVWGVQANYATKGKGEEEIKELGLWLVSFQEYISRAPLLLTESIETQKADIKVTREWLHMLAWQMSVRFGLLVGSSGDSKNTFLTLKYPFVMARELAMVVASTQMTSLESHGVGMEQKVSDVAMCLTDLMTLFSDIPELDSFRDGKYYLRIFLNLLSNFRGERSPYLDPILKKALPLVTFGPPTQLSSSKPFDAPKGPGESVENDPETAISISKDSRSYSPS
ncbi:hypothetical protein ABW19_dt0200611 [Dactylella cylindrospora]|nr:hypothetical protein ABW19_dt0200611 [Dactylella cylindrospora]